MGNFHFGVLGDEHDPIEGESDSGECCLQMMRGVRLPGDVRVSFGCREMLCKVTVTGVQTARRHGHSLCADERNFHTFGEE